MAPSSTNSTKLLHLILIVQTFFSYAIVANDDDIKSKLDALVQSLDRLSTIIDTKCKHLLNKVVFLFRGHSKTTFQDGIGKCFIKRQRMPTLNIAQLIFISTIPIYCHHTSNLYYSYSGKTVSDVNVDIR